MSIPNEDECQLWLRCRRIGDIEWLARYRGAIGSVVILGESVTTFAF